MTKTEQIKRLGIAYRSGSITKQEAMAKLAELGRNALQASAIVQAWDEQVEIMEGARAKNKVT